MMKHKLTIEQRVAKLERLLKCEADEAMRNIDDNDYSPKYTQAAQRVYDRMEEISARLEAVPSDMDTLHMDKQLLYKIQDSISSIKEIASMWL